MTYPAWPAALGCPIKGSVTFAFGDGRRRVRTDAGPGSVGRKFSAVVDRVSMSFRWNTRQIGIFRTWYREDVDGGAGLWTMGNPLADGWPLLDENNKPVLDESFATVRVTDTWLCRFGEQLPDIGQSFGTDATVTFEVDVMP